ncbi:hypothetical protein [Candidatus Manganitrophus noduliformans]|uniref:Uncharacterized protein n=1 Tax=Candidatus Manganitrophus noduliformans TaxID=2606439 RepID=A0A7X6ICU4_9BACT|nr:hypothetical protein [Candidatus Manganitrophus noduliformans]NKE72895.1 hypothetical protein [Candidatus Manganitrophus noduliformans]
MALITRRSQGTFQGDFRRTARRILHLLNYSGIECRRWLAPGESPIRLLSEAVARAEAGCGPSEIDLLVYVGGGFRDPGNA